MKNINWNNATPEQKVLWDEVSALIAFNTITPINFMGLIAGSEFIVYAATKLYIGLQIITNGTIPSTVYPSLTLYNELDQARMVLQNNCTYWNASTAAVNYSANSCVTNNVWFSRIVNTNILQFAFIGYRIEIV